MIAASEDGEAVACVGGEEFDEHIGTDVCVLRGLGCIAGEAYACGMKRQVYRRVGEDQWVAMHAPAPDRPGDAGFEAIAGFGPDELYAVGWHGEIWMFDGAAWHNMDSPTNLILTGLCCASDGQVYICGQDGTILVGRQDQWRRLDLADMGSDLWDIHEFNATIYVASMTGLYTLQGEALRPVDFGAQAPRSCYRLTSAEGVLWSIGAANLACFDGTHWTLID